MTDTIKTWQERSINNAGWFDTKKAMQAEIDELRAALAQQAEQVPEGYQLVPYDETADMQIAFYSKVTVMPQGHILNFSEGYKAMLAAAPKGGV